MRFLYGAYRFHEEESNSLGPPELWMPIVNVFGNMSLFILFYVTGLAIRHPYAFFSFLVLVHFADLLWFCTVLFSRVVPKKLRKVMRCFVGIDLATCAILGFLVYADKQWHWGDIWFVTLGATAMVILGVLDILVNGQFFLNSSNWQSQE